MKRILFLFLVCGTLVFPGCFIPTMEHHEDIQTRGAVDEDVIGFLKTGKTTREDILMAFGEPDYCWARERKALYHWKMTWAYWAIAAPGGGGAAGSAERNYVLVLEFDTNGILRWFEIKNDTPDKAIAVW
jgi:outer membrane protein assembly factor BamE (lipoprotein component of BamABCDE complex)